MKVLQISAECYPAAKAGGLGDVVGALPKYLIAEGIDTGVIIPKYSIKYMYEHKFNTIMTGTVRLGNKSVAYAIEQEADNSLGFPFFVVNVPGLFDREGIYTRPNGWGFPDEVERYLCFQQAVLHWVMSWHKKPILHCHDHHTGLIPFMIKHCPEYKSLAHVPTVFTIHNGVYHGAFSWNKLSLMPYFDTEAWGILDWANTINPLAAAIKSCWQFTTVSPGYLQELSQNAQGLEGLIRQEWPKAKGIINGIDDLVWDPKTDSFLNHKLKGDDWDSFKAANKALICAQFGLNESLPLIAFIGRMVAEKGADLLPDLIHQFLGKGGKVAFVVLGDGDPTLAKALGELANIYKGRFNAYIGYSEALSHNIYAGADFLFMPSRVEPCGLNQMYAMRYGTVPIVRSIGGLKDTVTDIGQKNGSGIRFDNFTVGDAFHAVERAAYTYINQPYFKLLRKNIGQLNFSWKKSVQSYIEIYKCVNPSLYE
jgi:starch synthase